MPPPEALTPPLQLLPDCTPHLKTLNLSTTGIISSQHLEALGKLTQLTELRLKSRNCGHKLDYSPLLQLMQLKLLVLDTSEAVESHSPRSYVQQQQQYQKRVPLASINQDVEGRHEELEQQPQQLPLQQLDQQQQEEEEQEKGEQEEPPQQQQQQDEQQQHINQLPSSLSSLSLVGMTPYELGCWRPSVHNLSSLQQLTISSPWDFHNPMDPDELPLLADLSAMTALKELRLLLNEGIFFAVEYALPKSISKLQQLEVLEVRGQQRNEVPCIAATEEDLRVLAQSCPKLRELGNLIGWQFEELSQQAAGGPCFLNVTRLGLVWDGFSGGVGCAGFGHVMPQLQQLSIAVFYNDHINDVFRCIVQAPLAQLTDLRLQLGHIFYLEQDNLMLEFFEVQPQLYFLKGIAEHLSQLRSLSITTYCFNHLELARTLAGLSCFAGQLEVLHLWCFLYMYEEPDYTPKPAVLGSHRKGLRQILGRISQLQKLRVLTITGLPCSIVPVEELVGTVQQLTELQEIELVRCGVKKEQLASEGLVGGEGFSIHVED